MRIDPSDILCRMIREVEPLWVSERNVTKLGEYIHRAYTSNGLELPKLVVLPRSGYTIGEIISRQWGVSGRDMLHVSIGERLEVSTSDKRPNGVPSQFACGQFPTQAEIVGADLLVLDAVAKTGETLAFAAAELKKLGANTVRTAVLYEKASDDNSRVEFPPDFSYERKDPWKFTIFAWEMDEYLPMPESDTEKTWNAK